MRRNARNAECRKRVKTSSDVVDMQNLSTVTSDREGRSARQGILRCRRYHPELHILNCQVTDRSACIRFTSSSNGVTNKPMSLQQ